MRTLDEVIEIASDWTNGFDEMSIEKQMLYYLKMYRSDMQMYADNQKYWEDELKQKIKDFGDAKDRYINRLKELNIGTLNEPLTWEQLKQMEGKPVWIEVEEIGYWYIIEDFEEGKGFDDYMITVPFNQWWKSSMMSKTWNAYRKERDD